MAKNVGDRKCDKLLLSSSFLLLLLFCWHDGFLNILVFIFEHPKHHIPVHHGLEGPLQLLNGLYALVDPISLTQKVYTDFFRKIGLKERGEGERRENRLWTPSLFPTRQTLVIWKSSVHFWGILSNEFWHFGWKMEFCYVYGIFEYQVFTSRVRNSLLIFHSTDIIYS